MPEMTPECFLQCTSLTSRGLTNSEALKLVDLLELQDVISTAE